MICTDVLLLCIIILGTIAILCQMAEYLKLKQYKGNLYKEEVGGRKKYYTRADYWIVDQNPD